VVQPEGALHVFLGGVSVAQQSDKLGQKMATAGKFEGEIRVVGHDDEWSWSFGFVGMKALFVLWWFGSVKRRRRKGRRVQRKWAQKS